MLRSRAPLGHWRRLRPSVTLRRPCRTCSAPSAVVMNACSPLHVFVYGTLRRGSGWPPFLAPQPTRASARKAKRERPAADAPLPAAWTARHRARDAQLPGGVGGAVGPGLCAGPALRHQWPLSRA
eukprot:scaffold3352_cov326-Prasinococcus_capsulatus_cf.AAC.5